MHVRERVQRGYRAIFSPKKTEPPPAPLDYERRALEEIGELKNPEPTRLASALDRIHRPIASAADAALDNKVGAAVSRGVQRLMDTLGDRASWSVRRDVIYEEFCSAGHAVHEARDIHRLALSDVDGTVGGLATKSVALAFAEGAGTGILGLAGTAIDIPSLVSIALRAISEYATYYGFDPAAEDERAFGLMLLSVASAPTVEERRTAMTELTKLSVLLAGEDSRTQSRRLLSMQMVTKLANTFASRIARAKTAQSIPVVGAGIAATFNAWFLRTVTQTAYELYRERFLIEKRGPGVVVPVKPGPRAR